MWRSTRRSPDDVAAPSPRLVLKSGARLRSRDSVRAFSVTKAYPLPCRRRSQMSGKSDHLPTLDPLCDRRATRKAAILNDRDAILRRQYTANDGAVKAFRGVWRGQRLAHDLRQHIQGGAPRFQNFGRHLRAEHPLQHDLESLAQDRVVLVLDVVRHVTATEIDDLVRQP